ncbi:MAG: GNAT family N-acetyltransferase [Alphaproteobacteria bacterium]
MSIGQDWMTALAYRRARAGGTKALDELEDLASGGLAGEFWALMAKPGQAPLEAGTALLARKSGVHTYRDATICLRGKVVAGMVLGYQLKPDQSPSREFQAPDALVPIFELETQASDCWYIDSLAVFQQLRRQGIATALLRAAQKSPGKAVRLI